MKRILIPLIAAALALVGAAAPTPARADAESLRSNAATVAALVDAHNAIRRENKLEPLLFVPHVAAEVSQEWTLKMQAAGKISHNTDFRWDGARAWGENVGWNVGYANPVQQMMEDWMDSPGHRGNIVEGQYTHIAVGAVLRGTELYATVNFYRGPLNSAGTTYTSGAQWLTAVNSGASVTNPANPDDVYSKAGTYAHNNRLWRVTCEPYSRTTRCRTEIWATVISMKNGQYNQNNGWAFNNLTYQPSPRSLWKGNPLATKGDHVINGRKWRTECDTAATGRNGCRSFIQTAVIAATPKTGGGYTYKTETQYVFNNIVRFS